MNNKSRMHLHSLVVDFMLYLKEYTRLLRFLIIENQKNGDNTMIAGQIIMIFTINWIIAHPYFESHFRILTLWKIALTFTLISTLKSGGQTFLLNIKKYTVPFSNVGHRSQVTTHCEKGRWWVLKQKFAFCYHSTSRCKAFPTPM